MNKKGQADAEQLFLFAEIVLGILVATIFILNAANIDSISNINKVYAEEDLTLLTETLLMAPGSIEYDYIMKNIYDVDISEEGVTITKTFGLFDGLSYYTLHFEKEQGGDLVIEKNA